MRGKVLKRSEETTARSVCLLYFSKVSESLRVYKKIKLSVGARLHSLRLIYEEGACMLTSYKSCKTIVAEDNHASLPQPWDLGTFYHTVGMRNQKEIIIASA